MRDALPQSLPGSNKLKRRFVLIGLGLLVIILVPVVILAGMFVKECLMAPPPPLARDAAGALLVKPLPPESPATQSDHPSSTVATNANATRPADRLTTASTTDAAAVEARQSETTRTLAASAVLTYEPMIPDALEIPPNLSGTRTELNRQFDRVLRDVEAYERAKDAMSVEEAMARIKEIEARFGSAWNELNREVVQAFKGEAEKETMAWYLRFLIWEKEALIELHVREKNWGLAAARAQHQLGESHYLWMISQDQTRPVFKTDFYRGPGGEDWKRMMHFYRLHGFHSYMAGNFLDLKKDQFVDYLGKLGIKRRVPSYQ